ncbi:MAG TPA: cytochrome b N-terminal domain-containing protein [Terriglobia bacterium]|nr:cytochrome b N-terminal domain-containing protein [Terracidiphilus sp.]HUY14138.1 cytochrome b N-terminal domain-containing protein [Terriglobia bacterium]
MNLIREIWQSIVRRDPLSTDKGKSELVFLNVWLHIHPAKVKKEHLKFRYTFYLGFITFFLFIVLVTTGIALMCYYRPYPPVAYQDMKDLQFVVFLGPFLRAMHRWAAHGMVICVFLHMCRVFYTGSYKKPRQFNWVVGVILLLLTLGLSFTGYLLPWDQLAYWAITVGTNIGSYAPLVGGQLKLLLLGGHTVGEAALIRFYVLHVAVLPSLVILLTIVHFWRIRKDGGLSRPPWKLNTNKPEALVTIGATPETAPLKTVNASTDKTYGLMEVVTGKPIFETVTPEEEEDTVFSYPYAFFREAIALMVTVTGIMAVSLLFHAPLEAMANPAKTPNPAKAPWYFLGLQELVSHSALLGGVVAPALMVLALLAIPYFDRNPSRRPSDRKWAIWLFTIFVVVNLVLIIIGTFFRGPGWAFVPPWVHVVAGAE